MKQIKSLAFYILIILILSGCTKSNEVVFDLNPYKEDLSPNSCIISGVLLSNNKDPISNEVVWLGEVLYTENNSEGQFIIEGGRSPSTISDEQGRFVFTNVAVNDYVIVIGHLELDPLILPDSENPNKAAILNCADGEIINIGEIIINLHE
jgi:hypothetical protein